MKIGLVPNKNKEKVLEALNEIKNSISKDIEIVLDEKEKEYLPEGQFTFGDLRSADVLVTLGGDGTIIRAARSYVAYGKPILGVNLGTLGFLTEIPGEEIKQAISKLEAGSYNIEERMMIEAKIIKDDIIVDRYHALNDIVLARKSLSRMVEVTVKVNNILLDDYYADGIIISTPTGSTGYSLSAGGPIMEPNMKMMIITPICPHSLNSRPVIISNEKVIMLQPSIHKESETALTIDGQINIDIEENMKIEISQAEFTTKLVKLNRDNYYETLRKKLFER